MVSPQDTYEAGPNGNEVLGPQSRNQHFDNQPYVYRLLIQTRSLNANTLLVLYLGCSATCVKEVPAFGSLPAMQSKRFFWCRRCHTQCLGCR